MNRRQFAEKAEDWRRTRRQRAVMAIPAFYQFLALNGDNEETNYRTGFVPSASVDELRESNAELLTS